MAITPVSVENGDTSQLPGISFGGAASLAHSGDPVCPDLVGPGSTVTLRPFQIGDGRVGCTMYRHVPTSVRGSSLEYWGPGVFCK